MVFDQWNLKPETFLIKTIGIIGTLFHYLVSAEVDGGSDTRYKLVLDHNTI